MSWGAQCARLQGTMRETDWETSFPPNLPRSPLKSVSRLTNCSLCEVDNHVRKGSVCNKDGEDKSLKTVFCKSAHFTTLCTGAQVLECKTLSLVSVVPRFLTGSQGARWENPSCLAQISLTNSFKTQSSKKGLLCHV